MDYLISKKINVVVYTITKFVVPLFKSELELLILLPSCFFNEYLGKVICNDLDISQEFLPNTNINCVGDKMNTNNIIA